MRLLEDYNLHFLGELSRSDLIVKLPGTRNCGVKGRGMWEMVGSWSLLATTCRISFVAERLSLRKTSKHHIIRLRCMCCCDVARNLQSRNCLFRKAIGGKGHAFKCHKARKPHKIGVPSCLWRCCWVVKASKFQKGMPLGAKWFFYSTALIRQGML